MKNNIVPSFKEAIQKLEKYCAYQERCQLEVMNKLKTMGLNASDASEICLHLVQNNFLNEERFAMAFAGGKFRQKQWGLKKIEMGLKAKKISPYCIVKALQSIDPMLYKNTLYKSAEKYWNKVKFKTEYERQAKTIQYLRSRGFDFEQSHEIVLELRSK
jgi:regulatory protein